MADLGHTLALWRRLAGARTRSQMQYPGSFALLAFVTVLGPLIDLVALLVVFENTPALGGWSRDEVILLYAVAGTAFWTGDATVGCVDTVSQKIRDGSFDAFLLRPVPSLVQVCADAFAIRRVARLVLAAGVLVAVLRTGVVDWTPARAAVLAGAVVLGLVLFGSIWVATAAFAFWVVDSREFGNAFTYGGGFLANQPLDIYGAWLRRTVTYVVPIAFAAYLPVGWVLGKTDSRLVWLTPAVALAAVLVARTVWRNGIRHYRSTGS